MASLSLDTINYVAKARKTEALDLAKALKNLQMDLEIDYDSAGVPTVLYNAVPTALINDLTIGGGKNIVFEADGMDLYWLLWALNHKEPQISEITTGVAAGKKATMQMNLPVLLNPGQISTPKIRVKWGQASDLGVGHTVNSGSLDGSYNHVEKPLKNQKVLPLTEVNTTTRNKKQLDAEGRIVGLLVLTRDAATPFTMRNHIIDFDLLIEGTVEVQDLRWEQAQGNFNNLVKRDDEYIVGVAYIDLSDRNIIVGNQSYLKWEGDTTPTDVKIYQIFQRVLTAEPSPTQDLVNDKSAGVKVGGILGTGGL